MNVDHIKRVLTRYFEAETSLAEEKMLKDFFNSHPALPEELERYRSFFGGLSALQTQQATGNITLRSVKSTGLRRWLPYAAAAVVLLGCLALCWQYTNQPLVEQRMAHQEPKEEAIDWDKYEPKDPEKALEITTRALQKASVSLSYGAGNTTKKGLSLNIVNH